MAETIIQHWESVNQLAARARLSLAQRLQNQYERLDAELTNLRASQSWLAAQDGHESAYLQIAYIRTLALYSIIENRASWTRSR